MLFYLSGITLWSLFSDIFMSTSSTITFNADVFQKVYFPRLVVPLSLAGLHFIRFLIQLSLLLLLMVYFAFTGGISVSPMNFLYAIPVFITIAGTAMGIGLLFAILTAKYRDLSNILGMINSLLMFVCPIFYPLSMVPEKVRWLVSLNPLSVQFELFRFAFLGVGTFNLSQLIYSSCFMIFILITGILFFNKKCDELIDVV
jgi:lipopolysaccharide transport system permease protein